MTSETRPHVLSGLVVLVIEDDPVLRRNLVQWFDQIGCKAAAAQDGVEGLALFRRLQPQAVITDLIMPNREGIETLMTIKKEAPGVKILAISGGGRIGPDDLLRTAWGLGADAVLAKPFRSSEVVNAVARLLQTYDA